MRHDCATTIKRRIDTDNVRGYACHVAQRLGAIDHAQNQVATLQFVCAHGLHRDAFAFKQGQVIAEHAK
jgi:hypothetical protein